MTQNRRLAAWLPTSNDADPGEIVEVRGTSGAGKVIPTAFRLPPGAGAGINEAPIDDLYYARVNGDWLVTVEEAPQDGQIWARKSAAWQPVAPFPEAPADGKQYARSDGDWVEIVLPPIIDGGTY
jgi:hypothetical protein